MWVDSESCPPAKTHLSELLEKVKAGEEITITKHGAAVAKLVPVKREASAEQRTIASRKLASTQTGEQAL